MPSVDYLSSSDSDEQDQAAEPSAKRRKVSSSVGKPAPALPDEFYSLYATSVRTSTTDDPTLHGGRHRQVAHREGNWPTHIYLEWYPTRSEEDQIKAIIDDAGHGSSTHKIHSLLRSDLDVQLPLHISLSAPLVLETDQRDQFLHAVQDAIEQYGARTFIVTAKEVAWASNFDKTRWFLVLRLSTPENDDLNRLLKACNACAREYGQPELYKQDRMSDVDPNKTGAGMDDRFHISIAWTLEKPDTHDSRSTSSHEASGLYTEALSFTTVKLKIGNAVHDISLPATDSTAHHPP